MFLLRKRFWLTIGKVLALLYVSGMLCLTSKRFWLTIGKVLALLYVSGMLLVQVPELRYDLGSGEPLMIEGPQDLPAELPRRHVFVSLAGSPSFAHAFQYQRYGLNITYFTLEEYDLNVLVKTYDRVTDEWKGFDRFVGRLGSFDGHHFSSRLRVIFQEKAGVEVPQGAYVLGLYDNPRVDGWQMGAVIFSGALWAVMFYFFFLWRRKTKGRDPSDVIRDPSLGAEGVATDDG